MAKSVVACVLAVAVFASLASSVGPSQKTRRKDKAARSVTSGQVGIGMTLQEVRDLIGQPEEVTAADGVETWHYYTYDAYSRRSGEAVVSFRDNLVVAFDRHDLEVPPVGQSNVLAPVYVAAMQQQCRFTTDCASGQFCRQTARAGKMCMGNGGNGAVCRYGTDCAGGLFCRDRGDGLEVCMGSGGRGASCKYGTDCGPGMFCRQDSDGYKRCR